MECNTVAKPEKGKTAKREAIEQLALVPTGVHARLSVLNRNTSAPVGNRTAVFKIDLFVVYLTTLPTAQTTDHRTLRWLLNNDAKLTWKMLCLHFRPCPGIYLQELSKTTRNLSQDSPYRILYSNLATTDYKSEALSLIPTRLSFILLVYATSFH